MYSCSPIQHGQEYNQSPARKLSQSFHLDIVGGKAITSKQTLLGAIDTVIASHSHLKRSEDSHFKAFVCLALKWVFNEVFLCGFSLWKLCFQKTCPSLRLNDYIDIMHHWLSCWCWLFYNEVIVILRTKFSLRI